MEGSNVEEFVAKSVRSGHSPSNMPNTLALSSGRSGMDSLTRSASAAAAAASVVNSMPSITFRTVSASRKPRPVRDAAYSPLILPRASSSFARSTS